ncbi:MAG: bestrophin family ion channel [Planctomycetales bacterium]|jgi:ion channel-forming bestrophin family protein|nr:bestrophin family ion channel [Planctomycetales bacterium]
MVSRVSVYALLIAAYAAIPAFFESRDNLDFFSDVPADIHAALTLVLGWLLVFRTNTSYARWWEARTLWGGLVNTIRNLSLKYVDLIDVPENDLEKTKRILRLFPRALKDHLRDGASLEDSELMEEGQSLPQHVPTFLVSILYSRLRSWKKEGIIDGSQLIVMDEDVRKLMEIVGGCEKIRNTRLARSYRTFARQCVFMYLFSLPWGIVHDFNWWTVPLSAMISYFMLGMEIAAEHTEEPFGEDEDDLDLEGLCRVIEASVDEVFAK